MRSSGRSTFRNASINACGSLAARASFTIRPASSTTQIAVSSKDTSSPAKYFMAAPPDVCAIYIDHVLTSRQEQPPSIWLGRDPNTPSVEEGSRLALRMASSPLW